MGKGNKNTEVMPGDITNAKSATDFFFPQLPYFTPSIAKLILECEKHLGEIIQKQIIKYTCKECIELRNFEKTIATLFFFSFFFD